MTAPMRLERETQLSNRAEYVLLCGVAADAHNLGDFCDRPSFEMPQGERHALEWTHLLHRRPYEAPAVGAGGKAFGIGRGGSGGVGDVRDWARVVHVRPP